MLRVGVCLLPDVPWADNLRRWQEAEARGFHSAWTYDHLSWRSLRDGPWYAAVPMLAAAAQVTRTIRLGPLVSSPNFRHPVTFAKELMTLDDVCAGRLDVGIGAGGVGADATVLGGELLDPATRRRRFAEFVDHLDTLLTHDASSMRGEFYAADDARNVPGCIQRPRVPFTLAAAGPRAMRVVARHAQTWVTTGPLDVDASDETGWWRGVDEQSRHLDEALDEAGRAPGELRRMVLVGLQLTWAQQTPAQWDDVVGGLAERGFTDVVVHWPRPHGAGLPGPSERTFDHLSPLGTMGA